MNNELYIRSTILLTTSDDKYNCMSTDPKGGKALKLNASDTNNFIIGPITTAKSTNMFMIHTLKYNKIINISAASIFVSGCNLSDYLLFFGYKPTLCLTIKYVNL